MSTLYHTETVTKLVNNLPVDFVITVTVAQDDIDPDGDFDFGDDETNAAYLARFTPNSGPGELFMGVICVMARAVGCDGADYLGGCHLPAVRGDGGKELKAEVLITVRDHDMINNAIAECIQEIEAQDKLLAPYAAGVK